MIYDAIIIGDGLRVFRPHCIRYAQILKHWFLVWETVF